MMREGIEGELPRETQALFLASGGGDPTAVLAGASRCCDRAGRADPQDVNLLVARAVFDRRGALASVAGLGPDASPRPRREAHRDPRSADGQRTFLKNTSRAER